MRQDILELGVFPLILTGFVVKDNPAVQASAVGSRVRQALSEDGSCYPFVYFIRSVTS